ncbi:MAG TPA: CoA pyrophosphatase [Vicinamibacteria bacterium]|nr:CoA pyrophosphatase [Vicinamibacteria bacterium]
MDLSWEDVRAALAARAPAPVIDPPSSRAAVALVLRDGPRGLEVLFIRRAEHPLDPWSGQMAFPGGRAEPGDADLRATAVRETREEIGVDLETAAEVLGGLDEVRAMARMRPMNLTITPYVFRLRQPFDPVLSDEVRSMHWLPLGDLLGTARRSTMDYAHQGVSMQFPCLRVDEVVIWGLTYGMFMSFQERFGAGPEGPDAALPPPA